MPHGLHHRQSPSDQFRVWIPPIKRPVKDWKTECLYIAKNIQEKSGKKQIMLFLSGGIDSSAVALCLKELEIEFQPVIIKFIDDLNKHDIRHAFSLCERINLSPRVIEINPFQELQEKGLFFSEQSQCVSPQLVLPLIVSDSLDGFFVFGGGDPYFEWCENREDWLWEEEEKFYSPAKYFIQGKISSCTYFFSATPELILAQLLDSLTQSFLKSSGDYFDFMKYKNDLYKKHFGISSKESYTGFEKLENEDKLYRKSFSSNPLNVNQILHIPVRDIIKKLSQESKGIILQ